MIGRTYHNRMLGQDLPTCVENLVLTPDSPIVLQQRELSGVEPSMAGRAETQQIGKGVGALLGERLDVVGIGIEIAPLLLTAQCLDPAGTINPGTADLALKVIEAFDSLLESALAVEIALRAQLYRLVGGVDRKKTQKFLIDACLGSLGQKRLPYPVGSLDMVGMVIRVLLLDQFLSKVS